MKQNKKAASHEGIFLAEASSPTPPRYSYNPWFVVACSEFSPALPKGRVMNNARHLCVTALLTALLIASSVFVHQMDRPFWDSRR